MPSVQFPITAEKLGQALGAPVVGHSQVLIERLSSLDEARSGSLAFFSNPKLRSQLDSLETGVVLLANESFAERKLPFTLVLVQEPKKTFAEIARNLLPKAPWSGISDKASIHPTVKLGKDVTVGPGAILCENVVVGDGTLIYPSVYIGPNVMIGDHCELHPFVTLVSQVVLGNRVKIFSGSVLGSEGFGFLEGDSGYSEMPQMGWVQVEDDVRIGAKCTVDKSTLGATVIGRGTKIDDQVHIGHNCRIGKNCILCAQVGLAGSSVLEDGVILAGQVGVAGHLTIHKNAICGGQTGVTRDLEGNQKYFLTPAMPLTEALRTVTASKKLPEILRRIKKLEEGFHG